MIRDTIIQLVASAIRAAQDAGELPRVALPEVKVERPKIVEQGDYATPQALQLARAGAGRPRDVAEAIRRHLPADPAVRSVEVAGPGFLNFRLDEGWLTGQVDSILGSGEQFGQLQAAPRQRIQVEYVSANPTGPLTVGNGRGAVLGSTLVSVLNAAGHETHGEYYVNDAGTQIETFSRTLYARYQQLFGREVEIPENGYPGEYMIQVAERIREQHGDGLLREPGTAGPPEIGELGIGVMVERIREDLAALNVHYDHWFHERQLYTDSGGYAETLALLRQRGYVAEREGAVWFTSTDLGEDKDNVLIRSGGSPTYFASDIAYHRNKLLVRGYDRAIDIWGADHQGHVSRMKAGVAAVGGDPARLEVLLYQLVTVRRGGEVVRLSKRAGEIITLREIVDEVGADAARFFFLLRSADSQMDFDIDLARRQSNENPVYYVQYAHARIAGILRTAAERGLTPDGGDVRLLTHPAELALIRKMLVLPELVDLIARTLEPHHLPHYAQELAHTFTDFYEDVRVMGREKGTDEEIAEELTRARLKLVAAAGVALARVLTLMGMSAPERMERRDSVDADKGTSDAND